MLQYDVSMLSEGQAKNLGGIIVQVTRSILGGIEQAVKNLDLLSPENKQDILRWNGRVTPELKNNFFLDVFRDQCLAQPMALAVSSWDSNLTYHDLDNLSSGLAQHLKSLGVGPEIMVPICFEKSSWAIVAILAVLKAGGAYVPLDPAIPFQRLQNIVQQVNGRVILSSPQQTQLLATMDGVITVSEETMTRFSMDNKATSIEISPDQLAYVLFTSGSTGQPKGCAVEHRAMFDMACHGKSMQMHSGSRVLQFSSYGFGVSLIEIFCTLAIGATICMPSDHDRLNKITEVINAMDVSWALLTPTIVNTIKPRGVPCLKTLALAGEPPSTNHISIWAESVQIVVAYGFTEWCGICSVQANVGKGSNPQNVGVPSTAKFWLAEPGNCNKLAPIGTVAELLVGGPSLARGYLNSLQLTTESFVDSPAWSKDFRSNYEGKFYKTGDLVRFTADGSLIYLGRKNMQVKIRGQRIELGEVEYEIRRAFPDAPKVIVEVVLPADTQEPTLAAFILYPKKEANVVKGMIDETSKEFQSDIAVVEPKIRAALPKYMIPSLYIPLIHMPLTISGKVSRRQLREWAAGLEWEHLASYSTAKAENVRPGTEMEYILHRQFGKILALDPGSFGIHDSFFRLGGDSIRAIKLTTECRLDNIHLTIQDIFREKTIAKLAIGATRNVSHAVETKSAGPLGNGHETSLQPTSSSHNQDLKDILTRRLPMYGISYEQDVEDVYPCPPIQGMLVSQAKSAGHYQHQFVWKFLAEISEPIALDRLQHAWYELVHHHPMLRTIFVERMEGGSSFIQVVLKSQVALALAAQIVEESVFPPKIPSLTNGKDSLPRFTLCIHHSGEVRSALSISHALIDATSMYILIRDFRRAYAGHAWPRISLCNREYIKYLQTLSTEPDLEYWKDYLAGSTPCFFPQLSAEFYPPGEYKQVRELTLQLDNSPEFYRFSEETGITLASIFHLAWAFCLRSFTGMDSVCFGYLTSGRNIHLRGIDDAIGPCERPFLPRPLQIPPRSGVSRKVFTQY